MGRQSQLKIRLKAKILYIVLGLPFICMVLFGTISYVNMINLGTYAADSINTIGDTVTNLSKESLKNQARKQLSNLVSNQTASIDVILNKVILELNKLSRYATEIWSGPSIVDDKSDSPVEKVPGEIQPHFGFILAPGISMDQVKKDFNYSKKLEEPFMSVFSNNTNLVFVYLGTESGILRMYPRQGDIDSSYDPRKDSWYQRAAERDEITWSKVFIYQDVKEFMATCSMPFYSKQGKLSGVIGVDVSLQSIIDRILKTRVGEGGYAFLLDRDGSVIARPRLKEGDPRRDESYAVNNLSTSPNKELQALTKDMTEGKEGISICHLKGGDKYIAFAPLVATGWSLALVMPMDEIISPIKYSTNKIARITENFNSLINDYTRTSQITFMLVFVTILIIIIFFGTRLSNKITQPILTLTEGVKEIGSGNLEHRLEIRTGDEIEDLADTFNQMTMALKQYIEEKNREITRKERIDQAKLLFSGFQEVLNGEYSLEWMFPYSNREPFRKGEVLFNKGDRSDRIFYIIKGSVRLVEINKLLSKGEIIGEMGIFRSTRERTLSAVCESDTELYSITHEKLFNVYYEDPTVGFHLIQIITQRFIENLRAETKEKERIESELRIAQDIQTHALPNVFPPFPDRSEIDIFATMEPAKEVGGDFYDFFFIDENKLCFVIGDVSGKGVPAALFMMIVKTLFKAEALRNSSPEKVLYEVNNIIASENDTSMFITLFSAVLNTETGELVYANAGHNPPLIYRHGGDFHFIKPKANFVLGPIADTSFKSEKLELNRNDTIFLYTDGVTEATNPDNLFYTDKRLEKTISGFRDKDVTGIIKGIREDLKVFVEDADQNDDITMVAIRFNGPSSFYI